MATLEAAGLVGVVLLFAWCATDTMLHYETGRRFEIPTAMVNCADHQRN
jgi:hypothetical protein